MKFGTFSFLVLVACGGFSLAVSAAEGDIVESELLHQAAGGKLELTAGIGQEPGQSTWTTGHPNGYTMTTYNLRNANGVSANSTFLPVLVGVEYGLNPMFSLGATLGYGSNKFSISGCRAGDTCNSTTNKGMFDPVLFFKGRSAVGPGAVIYGAYLDFSVEKGTTDSSGNGNVATGGSTLTPFVGYQMAAGPGVFGARVQYDIYKGDRKSHIDPTNSAGVPQDETTTGGGSYVVDAFYEAGLGMVTLGGELFYSASAQTKYSDNGGPSKDNTDNSTTGGLQIYSPVHVDGITILPQLSYKKQSFDNVENGSVSISYVQIGASARFAF